VLILDNHILLLLLLVRTVSPLTHPRHIRGKIKILAAIAPVIISEMNNTPRTLQHASTRTLSHEVHHVQDRHHTQLPRHRSYNRRRFLRTEPRRSSSSHLRHHHPPLLLLKISSRPHEHARSNLIPKPIRSTFSALNQGLSPWNTSHRARHSKIAVQMPPSLSPPLE